VAGKQKGKGDDRYLWPEMLRVIRELKPRWVVGENVPGILRIAADDVCKDLEREGYDVGIFDYEAAAVGAPHRRERFFFVANNTDYERRIWGKEQEISRQKQHPDDMRVCENVAHARHTESSGRDKIEKGCTWPSCGQLAPCGVYVSHANNRSGTLWRDGKFPAIGEACRTGHDYGGGEKEHVTRQWWTTEPNVGRVANGIPCRVDRLKCLGNAVVPQQAYPVFRAIAEIERGDQGVLT